MENISFGTQHRGVSPNAFEFCYVGISPLEGPIGRQPIFHYNPVEAQRSVTKFMDAMPEGMRALEFRVKLTAHKQTLFDDRMVLLSSASESFEVGDDDFFTEIVNGISGDLSSAQVDSRRYEELKGVLFQLEEIAVYYKMPHFDNFDINFFFNKEALQNAS